MKLLLSFILFLVPVFSFAQKNFQKGYVITNYKDTIKGEIDYREKSVNPVSFTFKDEKGTMKVYTLKDCAGYGIYNMDIFERHLVDVSLSKTEIGELSTGPDLSKTRDTIFLKVLFKGELANLYSYTDKIKERFYISDKYNPSAIELIKQVYLNPNNITSITIDYKYISQLILLMRKLNGGVSADEQMLNRLEYNSNALLKVIAAINGKKVPKKTHAGSRFFIGGGLNVNQSHYTGKTPFNSANSKSQDSYLPYINGGIDVFLNPAIKRLIFRTELSASMNHYNISGEYPDLFYNPIDLYHSFDEITFSISPQVIYNVYNTEKLNIYFGVGFGFNYVLTSNNISRQQVHVPTPIETFEENDITIEKTNFSAPFSLGVGLNKRFEIVAGYTIYSSMTNYVDFALRVNRYRVGINYLLGRNSKF